VFLSYATRICEEAEMKMSSRYCIGQNRNVDNAQVPDTVVVAVTKLSCYRYAGAKGESSIAPHS
jgi:hypothetical protein